MVAPITHTPCWCARATIWRCASSRSASSCWRAAGVSSLSRRCTPKSFTPIITPYARSDYYKPGPDNEADRQAYNRWIRQSGTFDGVADFDALLRDPARPDYLSHAYDNDGLHPSIDGYRKMADAVPLDALKTCAYAAR
jgi:lysophospholipase L1-like esterase